MDLLSTLSLILQLIINKTHVIERFNFFRFIGMFITVY